MDWQLTCRVCLDTGDMVSLFDSDENHEILGDKYTFCCGVEVSKNDPLPTLICLSCVDRLTFAYQFRQQCIASNDTLKECLEEFEKSSAAVQSARASNSKSSKGNQQTEVITIKQENGVVLQYELPVEHEPTIQWAGQSERPRLAPPPSRVRGKQKKSNQSSLSPNQRNSNQCQTEALKALLSSDVSLKEEPNEESEAEVEDMQYLEDDFRTIDDYDDDPPWNMEAESEDEAIEISPSKKRGRPSKDKSPGKFKRPRGRPMKMKADTDDFLTGEDDGEDVLLKETIMAMSEPIPEHILNPKPKEKKKYHRAPQKPEKSHICDTCGKGFTSHSVLQSHINRHLGIKPFICSACGYSSVAKTEMQRHMLKHTGEKPYKCQICERRFGDYGSRQKHERLHLGLRPYQCNVCGKSFTYSSVLNNHMLTHTGEKKYSCAPCNKKFTKMHHLKYHYKIHHKDLYIKLQLEQDAKKAEEQRKMAQNLTGAISGQIIEGALQLLPDTSEVDQEEEMQVVEEEHESEEKETVNAVAGMQAIDL